MDRIRLAIQFEQGWHEANIYLVNGTDEDLQYSVLTGGHGGDDDVFIPLATAAWPTMSIAAQSTVLLERSSLAASDYIIWYHIDFMTPDGITHMTQTSMGKGLALDEKHCVGIPFTDKRGTLIQVSPRMGPIDLAGPVRTDYETQIAWNIAQLNLGGAGGNNTLIISVGPIYLQFLSARGATDALCEAVSNQFLPAPLQLSEEKIVALRELGFALPAAEGAGATSVNFRRYVDLTDPSSPGPLARMTLDILQRIYDCPADARPRIALTLDAWRPDAA